MVSYTMDQRVSTQSTIVANCRPDSNVLLVDACEAATMLSKSVRAVRAWDAAGLIPRPIRIDRSTLWRAAELQAWVVAGCPRRREWDGWQS